MITATSSSEFQRSTLLALTKNTAIDAGARAPAFQEICKAASQALDAARVSIWYYDTDREAIVCEELYEQGADTHSSGQTLFQKDFPGYFSCLREERVLAAHDAHTDAATAEFSSVYLTPLGINSMLDAPVRFEGKLWGVVCTEHVGPPRTWSTEEQTFGASIADFAARALSAERRAVAQTALVELNAKLERLVEQRTDDLARSVETLKCTQSQLRQSNEELQSQQEELRQSNDELGEKNKLLAEQKIVVEASRQALEEKAEQLARTSQYKSEFLSSMSHELRTPLNSLLILSQLLAENHEHNMSELQIKYAKTIQGAGKDLLALINDILDLSKIESGTVTTDLQDVSFASVCEQVEGTFRHVAQSRSLGFDVELAPGLPPSLYTDAQRLQQVLKNLLSNAFKFTEKGQVSVRIAPVASGWSVDHDGLNRAQTVIGLHVTDTGIGLAADKQKVIFEAFQQADTGTARKYGGTGLGLSISRELARRLGGELRLAMSSPGKGSTFVLYLPLRAPEPGQGRT